MAMTFSLKMTVEQAMHVKKLLQQDKDQMEAWIGSLHATDEEKEQAMRDGGVDQDLLAQF